MKIIQKEHIVSMGLAIFSMLFGAGNLICPLQVGMRCGDLTLYGLFGFMLTAVCLPVLGLIGILLFDGNYKSFFYRLGTVVGGLALFVSMMMIGPILAIPRTIALSHIMLAPFLPSFLGQMSILPSCIFALLFISITFLATCRENKIVPILGNVISPLLLVSLAIIIGVGVWNAPMIGICNENVFEIFKTNFVRGYETLDLISAIFFSSMVLSLIKRAIGPDYNPRFIALIGLQSGVIGIALLGIIYVGLIALGVYYGHGLEYMNPGILLRDIIFKVLGSYGALLVGLAVLMACLSTAIALSAVVAEYIENTLFRKNISFFSALTMVLVASLPLATFGLDKVLRVTAGPILYIGYPVLITLTFCNIAYKMYGFSYVKIPAIVTFIAALITYIW
jgi:LIVCS family branched-chain amino acid:cation transporter